MSDAYKAMISMNNALLQTLAHPEIVENIVKIRKNCISEGNSHEEPDMNQRILICHMDNRPCMMQCMNNNMSIRDSIYG